MSLDSGGVVEALLSASTVVWDTHMVTNLRKTCRGLQVMMVGNLPDVQYRLQLTAEDLVGFASFFCCAPLCPCLIFAGCRCSKWTTFAGLLDPSCDACKLLWSSLQLCPF